MSVSKTRIPVPKDKTVETYGHSGIERRRGSRDMTAGTIKIVAWLLLLSIIVLSVVPPTFRPVTVLPHGIEHLTMFSVTGLAFGIAYACRYRHTIALVLFAVGFATGIELFQL